MLGQHERVSLSIFIASTSARPVLEREGKRQDKKKQSTNLLQLRKSVSHHCPHYTVQLILFGLAFSHRISQVFEVELKREVEKERERETWKLCSGLIFTISGQFFVPGDFID